MEAKPTPRITPSELKAILDRGEPVTILDVRSYPSWSQSSVQIPGAIRVPPDEVDQHLNQLPRDRLLNLY